jgi:hypothetical protein
VTRSGRHLLRRDKAMVLVGIYPQGYLNPGLIFIEYTEIFGDLPRYGK